MTASSDAYACTFDWLVRNRESSVRLFNCITVNPAIAMMTVGEFLSNREESHRQLLGVQNLGRKTVTELCTLVEEFANDPETRDQQLVDDNKTPEKRAFHQLLSILSQIPFPAAILQFDISTRLRNGLKDFEAAQPFSGRWEADVTSFSDILADWPKFRGKLLDKNNLGRKSLVELEARIAAVVTKKLSARWPERDINPILTMDRLTEKQLDPLLVEILRDAAEEPSSEERMEWDEEPLSLMHGHDTDSELPPREQVVGVIRRLKTKEQDVILRRYGIGSFKRQKLEEVATQFYVTRERVRQVEANALRRLRVGTNIGAFRRLLRAEQDDMWAMLTGGPDLLMPSDLQERRSQLPPEFVLAIDVVYEGLGAWISGLARPAFGGWLRGPDEQQEIKRSILVFESWVSSLPGPIPLASMADVAGLPERHAAIAFKLLDDANIFEGYLCPGHLGSQARRTCRLHRLSLGLARRGPFDVATLYRHYMTRFPDDDVSPRAIVMQLQRAPHLFSRMFDGIWATLNSDLVKTDEQPLEVIPFDRAPAFDESVSEAGSIAGWLHEALSSAGPMRMVDLRDMAETQLAKKMSRTSVGAVLHMNPEFVRLAPGVYGLQRHVMALTDTSVPIPGALLGENHCRYYALSRLAGDPITLYPAWGYHLEAALCRWASTRASDEVFRSLLAVARPDEWSVSPDEQAAWRENKRIHGSFRIPQMQQTPILHLPSAVEFLAAAIYLRMTGSIAWTTVNRTSQRRLDNHAAASILALFVSFGLAEPTGHWCYRHLASETAASIITRITADLVRTGRLSWDKATLAELRNAAPKSNLGWCDQSDVARLLTGSEASAETASQIDDRGLGDLDAVFASKDWGSGFSADLN